MSTDIPLSVMRAHRAGHRATPEADIQRQIVAFLRAALPAGAIIHHSANEIAGNTPAARRRQAILVGMGVHPGFSDLMLISEGRVMFLEVKSATGRLRPSQEAFRDLVRSQGFAWALVRSLADVETALREHHFKTRIRCRP